MVFVYSCHFLVAKINPSTAYAVPLPLGKGGIKKPARQKQKHTVIVRTVTNTYEPAQTLNFACPSALSSLKGARLTASSAVKNHTKLSAWVAEFLGGKFVLIQGKSTVNTRY